MGIACRGSVKAGCAAFVNPRTGFLMPVRFSVYGPRGLSCPSRPPLPLRYRATPGAAVPAAASGGAAGARSAHKGGGLGPRLWFGWPGGQRPPGRQTPPPPQDPGGLLLPYARRTPLGRDDIPCSSCSLRPVLPPPVRPCRCATGQRQGLRCPLRPQGGRRARAARTKAGALAPAFGLAGRGAKGPPAAKRRRPPGTYRGPLPLWFIPALFDPFHGYAPRSIGGAFLRQKQKGGIKAVFSLLQVKG